MDIAESSGEKHYYSLVPQKEPAYLFNPIEEAQWGI